MAASLEEGDYGIEQKLIALFALQQIDSSIDKIRIIRGELPLEVQDLEDDVEGFRTRIEKVKAEIADIELNITTRKEEIVTSKALIKKYEKQQNEVKNSREYEFLSKEMEYQGLEVQLNEKKIKEANFALEAKKADLEKVEHLFDERNKDLDLKKSELDEIIEETQKDEKRLLEKSANFEKQIEPRLVEGYKRIRGNAKNGLAVVTVERNACGGCFSKIPPQRQMEIALHKKIIFCEYCGRILVDEKMKEAVGITQ